MGIDKIIGCICMVMPTIGVVVILLWARKNLIYKPPIIKSQMTGYYEDYKEFDDHYGTLYGTHEIDQMIVHRDILIVTYKRIL